MSVEEQGRWTRQAISGSSCLAWSCDPAGWRRVGVSVFLAIRTLSKLCLQIILLLRKEQHP